MQRIDADQIEAPFAGLDLCELEPLARDLQRQPRTGFRARSGIGHLPLADVAVDITDRDFQRVGTLRAAPARNAHAIRTDLLDRDLREIRNDIRLHVTRRIVNLVEQLLLASAN